MSKRIEVDDELYTYIASHTRDIGESASTILRRLLGLPALTSASTSAFDTAADAPATPASSEAVSPSVKPASVSPKRVFDVLDRADFAGQRSVVARFLHILAMLYRCHADEFDKVLQVRGRDRIYFALSEAELVEAGNSTNPKQIPDSAFWVITNNNTTRKKSMLTQVALELGYSAKDAELIRDFL